MICMPITLNDRKGRISWNWIYYGRVTNGPNAFEIPLQIENDVLDLNK